MKCIEINGHRCEDTGQAEGVGGMRLTLWSCLDCRQTATYGSFDAGLRGCPARPESLDYLSVKTGDSLGLRAARQWLDHAVRIGLKMSVWTQEAIANRVGENGGTVAEMTHQGRPYHVVVTRKGHLAAHPGNDYACAPCDELRQSGLIPV